ncbi:hypothetical protein [Treponema sp.]|uniref:hypothetical protein n=1 Tax=Treponema sp. TaxID=166 RepID=UPI00388DD772
MEIVDVREGYLFKIVGDKTFAVQENNDGVAFCPFCYSQIDFADGRCPCCQKNIPEIIYFHGDDQTWIASGNE